MGGDHDGHADHDYHNGHDDHDGHNSNDGKGQSNSKATPYWDARREAPTKCFPSFSLKENDIQILKRVELKRS